MAEMIYSTPLPPELLDGLWRGDISPPHNPEKAEVWSIGITLLAMILNEDFNNYYNWHFPTILFDIIENRLDILQKLGYSRKLFELVQVMINPDEYTRPDLDTVVNHVYNIKSVAINLYDQNRPSITTDVANRNIYSKELEDNNSKYLKYVPFNRDRLEDMNKSVHYPTGPQTFNQSAFNNQIC